MTNAKPKATARVAGDELDRCVFNEDEIREQIKQYETFIERALELLPETPSAEEKTHVLTTLRKVEEVQAELQILRARVNFDDFAEYVMTDDETGLSIKQAPIHRRWSQLCLEERHLIIWSHRNSGKTTQISVARTVWELGRDPTLRFLILSNTAEIATRIVKSISTLIEDNDRVKEVFPHLKPNPKGPWTNTQLQVVRDSNSPSPSVRAAGIHGSVTGMRVDRAIIDDILDYENTNTEAERKKTMAWYKATVPGCLTRRARVIIVGTAYNPKDYIHEMSRVRGYRWFRFPLIAADGTITWPEAWTTERIEFQRHELGPAEFARQFLCKARDDEESRFRQEWFDKAAARGNGLPLIQTLEDLPEDEQAIVKAFSGVDLSTGKKKKKTDKSSFFHLLQYPNGDRRIAMIECGKFTGPQIIERVEAAHERYGSMISVEDNGAQSYILQFASEKSNVPVVPHTTGKQKRDPVLGVEGLAIELANGKWIIPNDDGVFHPEIAEFITECLYFDPKTHTGDRLMSCYFARELARKYAGEPSKGRQATMRVIGPEAQTTTDEPYRQGVSLRKLFDVPDSP